MFLRGLLDALDIAEIQRLLGIRVEKTKIEVDADIKAVDRQLSLLLGRKLRGAGLCGLRRDLNIAAASKFHDKIANDIKIADRHIYE